MLLWKLIRRRVTRKAKMLSSTTHRGSVLFLWFWRWASSTPSFSSTTSAVSRLISRFCNTRQARVRRLATSLLQYCEKMKSLDRQTLTRRSGKFWVNANAISFPLAALSSSVHEPRTIWRMSCNTCIDGGEVSSLAFASSVFVISPSKCVKICDLKLSVFTTSMFSPSLLPDTSTLWLVFKASPAFLAFSACSKLDAAILLQEKAKWVMISMIKSQRQFYKWKTHGFDVICKIFPHVMSSFSTHRVCPLMMSGSEEDGAIFE